MSDHAELIAEQAAVDKMATGERLKHAKKKRAQQLKRYMQYERQLEKDASKKTRKNTPNPPSGGKTVSGKPARRIRFVSDVVLLEAAGRNDVEEVRRLLEAGVSPNSSNEDGLTALHQCCIDDSEEMLRLLIDHGANVNSTDSELWTPLHAAATCGHSHLCKLLIDNGAELLAVNADGNMPYDICEDEVALDYVESEMSKRGVTQELIDKTRLCREASMLKDLEKLRGRGGDLEYRGRYGETPLHISSANGYLQVTQFLLESQVRVDVLDNDTWQPIHCAACWGQLPVVEMLLENGASLEAKTKSGDTPVDVCEDVELRERMLVMKREIEKCRVSVSRELSRKRSTVIRSASIRRTSMREKKAISWKEAREEAARLRDTSRDTREHTDNDVEEDEERDTERSRLLSPHDSTVIDPGTVFNSSTPVSGDSGSLLTPALNGIDQLLDKPQIPRRRNSKYRSATRDAPDVIQVDYSSLDRHKKTLSEVSEAQPGVEPRVSCNSGNGVTVIPNSNDTVVYKPNNANNSQLCSSDTKSSNNSINSAQPGSLTQIKLQTTPTGDNGMTSHQDDDKNSVKQSPVHIKPALSNGTPGGHKTNKKQEKDATRQAEHESRALCCVLL